MRAKRKNAKKVMASILLVGVVFGNLLFCRAEDNKEYYLPGNDEYLKLEAFDVEEGVPGAFFMEAEDGLLQNGIMEKIYDEEASGGCGIAAESDVSRPIGDDIEIVDARFRFKITKPGLYTIYARCKTPKAKWKSTHFAFDDETYRRLDYSTILNEFVWRESSSKPITMPENATFSSAYLDEGTHVLNIKARQGGHILDSLVVSCVSWDPKGYGSLPGEEYRYTPSELETINYEKDVPKLTINGVKFLTDAPINKVSGDIMVPFVNVANYMGIEVKVRDGYCLAERDRDYIKIFPNSDVAVINGREVKLSLSTYLYEDNVLMAPISIMQKAFDITYSYDENDNTTYITTPFEEQDAKIKRVDKSVIEVINNPYEATVKLKSDRANAKVRIWIKRKPSSFYQDQWQKYTRSDFSYGWKGMAGSRTDYFWSEMLDVKYEDGGFVGITERLPRGGQYDVKIRVVDGDFAETFIVENAIKIPSEADLRGLIEPEDYVVTGGKLVLIPTFENVSFYIDETDSQTECSVYYREKGSEDWHKAYEPFYEKSDMTEGQYRGSIVYLKENTAYEVKAEILKDGIVVREESAECTTWTSDVPIAKTINISEVYENGSYKPLVLNGIKGSEDGWIKIVGDGKTVINAGREWISSVHIQDCQYLILEGLTIKGGERHGINAASGCENVRIINCDISEWGVKGVFNPWLMAFVTDGNSRNLDGGIRIFRAKNFVVERCYIHDTLDYTNPWSYAVEGEQGYTSKHPAGPSAITISGRQGLVIRWNDMTGSDVHRLNDVVESEFNTMSESGSGFDGDIYGNLMYCCEDDNLEVDSAARNVRVYENRMEKSLCGVSTAPTQIGPVYVFRNLITNRGASEFNIGAPYVERPKGVSETINYYSSHALKSDQGNGMQYIFNNTMSTNIRKNSTLLHGITRNNITTFSRSSATEGEIADYDLLTDGTTASSESYEPHGIFGQPEYIDVKTGNYNLKENSLGVNAGETLDNFSVISEDGKTDIGAFEIGGKYNMMPYRPIDMTADKSYALIDDGHETTVTFTLGDIPAGLNYRIHTNLQNEFLQIEGINCELSGEAKPNTTYTVKIKGNLDNHYYWLNNKKMYFNEGNGMIYLRLDNGFSVPVTVCVKK